MSWVSNKIGGYKNFVVGFESRLALEDESPANTGKAPKFLVLWGFFGAY